jgi:hypothetical protein
VGPQADSSTITDAIVMALRHDLAVAGVMAHARATELAGRRLQVFSRPMHFEPVRTCHRIDQHRRALLGVR